MPNENKTKHKQTNGEANGVTVIYIFIAKFVAGLERTYFRVVPREDIQYGRDVGELTCDRCSLLLLLSAIHRTKAISNSVKCI